VRCFHGLAGLSAAEIRSQLLKEIAEEEQALMGLLHSRLFTRLLSRVGRLLCFDFRRRSLEGRELLGGLAYISDQDV